MAVYRYDDPKYLWTMEIGDRAYLGDELPEEGIYTRVPGGWVFTQGAYIQTPQDMEFRANVFIPWIAFQTEKLNSDLSVIQIRK